ncbi:D-aminoacyl-tRNA deacylase-like [Ctenocephalides felis]|nr:D-aminoacyl-tRNA deacylase-like [Ctenocephalides felis]XP_026462229.1 D-aminoacyl-tRNA deacylase-like [Ctenocephalides felis]XP_026462235.1 D-aminoacyl-tRNA deacylase-like [Ctenocephalides felis]
MKALIQRVNGANVKVKGELISSIGKGLCVLIGISADDTVSDMKYL